MNSDYLTATIKKLADEREPWKIDHDEVMEKYKKADSLSELAALLNFLLSRLKSQSSRAAPENSNVFTVSWAEVKCEDFSRWLQIAYRVANESTQSKNDGFPVVGLDELRNNIEDVASRMPEINSLREKIKDFHEGRVTGIKEVLNVVGTGISQDGS